MKAADSAYTEALAKLKVPPLLVRHNDVIILSDPVDGDNGFTYYTLVFTAMRYTHAQRRSMKIMDRYL